MNLRWRRLLIRGTSFALRALYRLFGGFHVEGLEHLPAAGGAILAGNRLSWADPPAVRSVVQRTCWFIGNEELFRIPIIGRLLPLYGAFPVDRNRLDVDAVRVCDRHLKDGDLLCIFPEGGTTVTGTLLPFEGGAALLALRNDVPIIPFGITGTDKVLPPNDPRPRFARGGVRLKFGAPIYPGDVDRGVSRKERVRILTDRAHDAVAALLPPEYLPEELRPGRAGSEAMRSIAGLGSAGEGARR